MDLFDYDLVVVNSSGGKDSLAALHEVNRVAEKQGYPKNRIKVSHQELGIFEWAGTKELVQQQADLYGFEAYYSRRRDKNGYEENFLEYVLRRAKTGHIGWPDNKNRGCTSDFKRGPGNRIITQLTKDLGKCKILQVFGFRAAESPSRKKKGILTRNESLSTKKRTVHDWLPIHDWSTQKVWDVIKTNNLPYHWAYDLGMPRLSCVFCIFSPFDALVIAGMHNRDLLDKYIEVEEIIGHSFRHNFSLKEVRDAIDRGYVPKKINDWIM